MLFHINEEEINDVTAVIKCLVIDIYDNISKI